MKLRDVSGSRRWRAMIHVERTLFHVLVLVSIIPGALWSQERIGEAASGQTDRVVDVAVSIDTPAISLGYAPPKEPLEVAFSDSGLRWAVLLISQKYRRHLDA